MFFTSMIEVLFLRHDGTQNVRHVATWPSWDDDLAGSRAMGINLDKQRFRAGFGSVRRLHMDA